MVDTPDLGSGAARYAGSSPVIRTIKFQPLILFAINGIFIGGLTLDLQNVSYVELQYEDIPACGRIYFAAFNVDEKMREFYSVDKFFGKFISDNDKFSVGLKYNGQLIGFLVGVQIPSFYTDYIIYIDTIAIDPAFQGKGLGSFLITTFRNSLSDYMIILNAKKDDRPYQLYKKLGFHESDNVSMSIYPALLEKIYQILNDDRESFE